MSEPTWPNIIKCCFMDSLYIASQAPGIGLDKFSLVRILLMIEVVR